MKQRLTTKQMFVEALGSVRRLGKLSENTLTLITPIGIITGTLVDIPSVEGDPAKPVRNGADFLIAIAKGVDREAEHLAEAGMSIEEVGAGSILLEEASIHYPSNFDDPVRLGYLTVFLDQVIGVTIGKITYNHDLVKEGFNESEDASRRLDTGHEFGD